MLGFISSLPAERLAGKNVSEMTLVCVEWGVKPQFSQINPGKKEVMQ